MLATTSQLVELIQTAYVTNERVVVDNFQMTVRRLEKEDFSENGITEVQHAELCFC